MANVTDIFLAEKRIGFFPGWSKPEEETDYVWFDAPIEIGGVTESGLVVHGGCFAHRPDCHVTLELRLLKTPGRRKVPIERADWRSLEGGHSNKRKVDAERAGRRISESHLHDFWLNWLEQSGRMRGGNRPVAREFDKSLQSFAELRSYVGKRLRINNIDVVQEPPWVYDFYTKGLL